MDRGSEPSKWFYERARGGCPDREKPERVLRKLGEENLTRNSRHASDLQRKTWQSLKNSWRGLPHVVNRGGQKNFTQFMTFIKTELGDLPEAWEPAPEEFKRFVGKAILFRDVQGIVKAENPSQRIASMSLHTWLPSWRRKPHAALIWVCFGSNKNIQESPWQIPRACGGPSFSPHCWNTLNLKRFT